LPQIQECIYNIDKKKGRKQKIQKTASTTKAQQRESLKGKKATRDKVLWIQCDSCSKWRRLRKNSAILSSQGFRCKQLKKIDCRTRQEPID